MTPRWRTGASPALRARLGDAGCVLGALLVGGMATDVAAPLPADLEGVNALVGLAAAATLWWRRRAPLVVAALTFVAAAAAPLAAGAAIMSIFTVASRRPTRIGVAVAALYLAPGAISATVGAGSESFGESAVGAIVLTVAALGWGLAARSRRQAMDALAERAERAEAEQQARVAEARHAERTRIAAEMHDVLAHRLSLLSLHAGALELRPDAPAEELARSAAVVRANAHQALDELRDVIGVLRSDGAGDLAPPPTIDDLDALLAEAAAAGMDVEAEVTAPGLGDLPADIGRHAYRIVQEGLTNARKHAPGSPVRLALRGTPGESLTIEVANPVEPGRPSTSSGLGLVGLQERVATVGGRLEAAETDGVHRLCARLPWQA